MPKYLDLETSRHLVSLGCTHTMSQPVIKNGEATGELVPAFSLEDILRRDNAEKIWPGNDSYFTREPIWPRKTQDVLLAFQSHPDNWPSEVAKIIKP